ncbi:MAG: hypothetical protein ACOCXJ_00805 [Planctomycetota bacterium]
MNEPAFQHSGITVKLDPDILNELVYGGTGHEPRDPAAQAEYHRTCALRELLVYRLLRSIVSDFNGKMKGRRERLKLVEEGEGLVLEFGSS